MDGMGMWDNMAPSNQPGQINTFNQNCSNNQQQQMQQQQQQQQQQPAPPQQAQQHQPMAGMDKHNPVGSWQRGGWDSGIQSGATSQTPSVISGHSELSAIVSEFSEHIPDFNQSQAQAAPGSNQQQAAAQMQQMFDFQDEEGLATGIPKLIQFLKDNDTIVVQQASQVLHQFSKREAAKVQLINQRQVIPTLIVVLDRTNDPDTARAATGALHNISQSDAGRKAIFTANGVPALVKVLQCSVDAVVFYAITTIHNLLLHIKESKNAVRQTSAVGQMVQLLSKKTNVKFLAICTDCLHLIGYSHNESKIQMLHAGAAELLVNIMQQFSYEKLLWTTSRVLKVLSVCNANKRAIVQAGGVQALGMHLSNSSQRLVTNCLWTIRNLSDAATHLNGMEGILTVLLQRLQSSDTQTVMCAAGTIANFTCNNIHNKIECCRAGGIEALLRTIVNAGERQEIQEPAVCALRHITSRHPEAETAQQLVRQQLNGFGLQTIVKLLQPGAAKFPLRKAALGLLRNLAMTQENRIQLRDLDVIQQLIGICSTHLNTLQQNQNDREAIQSIDGCINVFSQLIRDNSCRPAVANNIQIFLQILRHQTLQQSVGVLLGHLCADAAVLAIVEREGARQCVEEIFKNYQERQRQQEQRQIQQQQQFMQHQPGPHQPGPPGWNPNQPSPGMGPVPMSPGFDPMSPQVVPQAQFMGQVPPPGPPPHGFDPTSPHQPPGHFHPGQPGHPPGPPGAPQMAEFNPQAPPGHPGVNPHQPPPPQPHHHGAPPPQQMQPHQQPMSNWFEPM